MQDATTVILMHVDCGYGDFCKRSPDTLYCKTALSTGSYAELYNQCQASACRDYSLKVEA